jgi:hypothetical protein
MNTMQIKTNNLRLICACYEYQVLAMCACAVVHLGVSRSMCRCDTTAHTTHLYFRSRCIALLFCILQKRVLEYSTSACSRLGAYVLYTSNLASYGALVQKQSFMIAQFLPALQNLRFEGGLPT